jgi:hypothetical protein
VYPGGKGVYIKAFTTASSILLTFNVDCSMVFFYVAQGNHVLNLGHGVEKDTPESAVAAFVNAAKEINLK